MSGLVAARLETTLQPFFPDTWDGGSRPGEFVSQVVGTAVLNPSDGSWSGGDSSAALRADFLSARALGLKLRLGPWLYIVTDSIVRTGEAYDNAGIRGVPGVTRLIQKSGSLAGNFQLLCFDGTLEVDLINGPTPTYYLTAPASRTATTAALSSLTAITAGEWLMLIDKGNPIYHWSASPTAGTLAGIRGQLIKVSSVAAIGPFVFDISAGSFDVGTGLFTVTTTGPVINYGVDAQVTLSGLTGTGDFLALSGLQITQAPTTGHTTTFSVAVPDTFDPSTTITSGTVSFGTALPNAITFSPALEFDFSGTSVSPFTSSTCIRRLSSCPKNVTIEGIIFDHDRTVPNKNTQARIVLNTLERPKVRNCEFYGRGTGISVGNGTHDFELSGCHLADGGSLSYAITITTGACFGRIFNVSAFDMRHCINTTASFVSSCGPAHITVTHCQAFSMAAMGFTDHPAVHDLWFYDCLVVGGRTSQAAGITLRGINEGAVNCRVFGCPVGVAVAAATNAVVDGGLYEGNGIAIQVIRSINTRFKNFPVCRDSVNSHIQFDNVSIVAPFDIPYFGMYFEAEVHGTPATADVNYVQRNTNYAPVFGDEWRFNIRSPGRTPTFIVTQPDSITPSFYAFREEFAGNPATKYADFNVVPRLAATYLIDPTAASVNATLPDPLLCMGQSISLKALNTTNATTIIGVVDGTTNPVLTTKKTLRSSGRRYQIVSGTYTSGSGLVSLTMREAVPFGVGASIVVSGLTGTGSFASANGAQTISAIINTKTIRFIIATGLGTVTFTGGSVGIGGWVEI